jgi:DNA invertase Pin-like site-specific DNA recombinase
VSSVAERDQLEAVLDYARDGDVLVVTKLDRLARSIRDLCSIVDRLTAKGVCRCASLAWAWTPLPPTEG